MADSPLANLFRTRMDKEIYAKRDVEAPCESVDWSGGLTIEAGEIDGHEWDDNILYVFVGVKPTLIEDDLITYLLDSTDIILGIMRAREIVAGS